MSSAVRWILAIFIILLGLAVALLTVFGGAFSTVACVDVPADWVYYILIAVALMDLGAAAVTAILITRKASAVKIAASALVAAVLMCAGPITYFALLGQIC